MMIDGQKLIGKLLELEDEISGEEADDYNKGMMRVIRRAMRWIDMMTVDAEPVVRCKNCRYYMPTEVYIKKSEQRHLCRRTYAVVEGDDFCSRAERVG